MKFLDKLSSIFHVEFNSPLIYVNTSKHNSDNKIERKNKKDIINYDRLSTKEKQELKQVLKEYIEEGNLLLEDKTKELLDKLYQYNKNNTDGKILNFFRNIIPKEDYIALKASLFLRTQFHKNRDRVPKLKRDIINNFGKRGRNISNLCTSGYFENFFMKLYNTDKKAFKSLYELIVSQSIIAIFVHKEMLKSEIANEIKQKISISTKYGIKFIHIHGIGKNNIDKIKLTLKENEGEFKYYTKKIYENKEEGIIVVELLLF